MIRPLLGAVLVSFVLSSPVSAIPITVDVSAAVGAPVHGFVFYDFALGSALNGLTFSGQTLMADVTFADDVLARVSLADPMRFFTYLILNTNAGTFPGFGAVEPSGDLLGANGLPLSLPVLGGQSDSSNGDFTFGFGFPLVGGYDISGAHFEATLPTTGYTVTGATFKVVSTGPDDRLQFGTLAQLPEYESSASLFGLGALVLVLVSLGRSRGWSRGPTDS